MDDKQNQTLIDYELLMKKGGAAEGKLVRAAAFGRYAGSESQSHEGILAVGLTSQSSVRERLSA